MKNIISILTIFIACNITYAQDTITYFQDTTSGNIDYLVNSFNKEDGTILIGVNRIKGMQNTPVIQKIDFYGNIIWAREFPQMENYNISSNLLKDDVIYCVFDRNDDYYNNKETILKIDQKTGVTLFEKDIISYRNSPIYFHDYNDTLICVTYLDYDTDSRILSIRNRETLDTIVTRKDKLWVSNGGSSDFHMNVDNNGNIYFTDYNYLYKTNGIDINTLLWKKQFPGSYTTQIKKIFNIYLDKYDELFIFGSNGISTDGCVANIDKHSGEIKWLKQISSNQMRNFKDFNDYLYINFSENHSGGGAYYYSSAQVEKSTGNIIWYKNDDLYAKDEQGSFSIDVDCEGYTYLTGSFNQQSATFEHGKWFVVKKDILGNDLFANEIRVDSSIINIRSKGQIIRHKNDTIFAMGFGENNHEEFDPYIVYIDSDDGSILGKKMITPPPIDEAQTKGIILKNDTLYVVKQLGTELLLESYDSNSNLIISKIISRQYNSVNYLDFQIVDNLIYILSTCIQYDYTSILYVLNKQGIIVNQLEVLALRYNPFISMEIVGSSVYILFQNTDNSVGYSIINSQSSYNYFEIERTNILYERRSNAYLNRLFPSNTDGILYYVGDQGIYTLEDGLINPISFHYSFIHDVEVKNGNIFIVGRDLYNPKYQTISAFDTVTKSYIWEKRILQNDCISKVKAFKDDLYTISTLEDTISITTYNSMTGDALKHYILGIELLDSVIINDYIITNEKLFIAGATSTDSTSNGFLITIDSSFSSYEISYYIDELHGHSTANTLTLKDTILLVGGAHNTIANGYRGFVGLFNAEINIEVTSDTTNPIDTVDPIDPTPIYLYRNTSEKDLVLSPNPCVDYLNLNIEGYNKYFIYNNKGQLVKEGVVNEKRINVGDLSIGGYYILLFNSKNYFKGRSFIKK